MPDLKRPISGISAESPTEEIHCDFVLKIKIDDMAATYRVFTKERNAFERT